MDERASCGKERARERVSRVHAVRVAALLFVVLATLFALAGKLRADEIRLKDGNKLYGVIVAYEDNMFKVRTPFGYVLVEKDKIADIVPSTIGSVDSKEDNKAAAKKDAAATAKHATPAKPAAKPPSEAETTTDAAADSGTEVAVSEKTVDPAVVRREKTSAILANSAVKPEVPAV